MHHNLPVPQIPVRSRGWAIRNKKFSTSTGSTIVGNSSFYMSSTEERKPRPLSSHGLTTEAIGITLSLYYEQYMYSYFKLLSTSMLHVKLSCFKIHCQIYVVYLLSIACVLWILQSIHLFLQEAPRRKVLMAVLQCVLSLQQSRSPIALPLMLPSAASSSCLTSPLDSGLAWSPASLQMMLWWILSGTTLSCHER